MAELLKNIYNTKFIQDLGVEFEEKDKSFDRKKFTRLVFEGTWPDLELKARMRRISECLDRCLSGSYPQKVKTLIIVSKKLRQSSEAGFEYMFFPDFVELYGMHDFETSIPALEELTKLASSEFAVRPFILTKPNKMLKQLSAWSKSSNTDVRRLASEGCRPRLPWAMALPIYKKDPQPILNILNKLKNDESLYVRRSVANNLNDISKDHPEVVVDLAKKWMGQSENTDWLVRHACRGLLKGAHPEALKLFGFGDIKHLEITNLKVAERVCFEEYLPFNFNLSSTQTSIGKLRIEYAIDFMKSNGKQARKIFKVAESDYKENCKSFERKHAFKTISTRKHYAGKHVIAILLNGIEVDKRSFLLEP